MRPLREHATNNRQTYFVTSATWARRNIFHAEPWARLFMEALYHRKLRRMGVTKEQFDEILRNSKAEGGTQ